MSKSVLPDQVSKFADILSSLPGIGPKLASRLAIYLTLNKDTYLPQLLKAAQTLGEEVLVCTECGNLSVDNVCTICSDPSRSNETVLVVESALDLVQIERTEEFKGKYVVLQRLISPVNGVTVKDTNLHLLLNRLSADETEEVIFGLPSSVEADATVLYISQIIESQYPNIKLTRLARGIASGVSIEYLDTASLHSALSNRVSVE